MKKIFFYLIFLLLIFSNPLLGVEKISSYVAEIYAQNGSWLSVKETIVIQKKNEGVFSGPVRFFPGIHKIGDWQNRQGNPPVILDQALLNGRGAPFAFKDTDKGMTLYFENQEKGLVSKKHTISLKYRIRKKNAFKSSTYGLPQWNLTQNHWKVPIGNYRIIFRYPSFISLQKIIGQIVQGGNHRYAKPYFNKYGRNTISFHGENIGWNENFVLGLEYLDLSRKTNHTKKAVRHNERILSFDSEIKVDKDGWLTIKETIQVQSGGQKIRRGIYRDFPTQYKEGRGWGIYYIVPFEVKQVLRDGKTDEYHFKNLTNGKRIYIGNKNVYLKPGIYTYTLVYRTCRQIAFFEDHHEVKWNVAGTGWAFPIDRVTARVTLPPDIPAEKIKGQAFTGKFGERGTNYKMEVSSKGEYLFSTISPLKAHEDLTLALWLPKGYIHQPTQTELWTYLFLDNKVLFYGALGLVLLLLYYTIAWVKVGIDPAKGTIYPQFEAPMNLSPGAVRHIFKMGYDEKCFTAAVLNMAVKKFLRIEEESNSFTLILEDPDESVLAPEEKKIAKKLFSKSKFTPEDKGLELELGRSYKSCVNEATDAFKDHLTLEHEKKMFFSNSGYFGVGCALTLITVGACALTLPATGKPEALFMCVWLSIWTIGVLVLLSQVFSAWKNLLFGKANKALSGGGALFITLFSIPFVAGEVFGFYALSTMTSPFTVAIFIGLLVLLGGVNALFHHLLKALTRVGRKVMDQIEGFKMYLSTAEEDRLNAMMKAPEKTPELFEKFLPFALALDVENEWAEKFSKILSESSQFQEGSYSPTFYSGAAFSTLGAAGFSSSFSSSFSQSVVSTSTPPSSSSSGFSGGGGGGSGGGGGGGGGGGW